MKDIKTAKQFYKLFTDKELTVLSIEQKMQLYAEYYHKAKVKSIINKPYIQLETFNAEWLANKLLNDL